MKPCPSDDALNEPGRSFIERFLAPVMMLVMMVSPSFAKDAPPGTLHVLGTLRSELPDGDFSKQQLFEIEFGSTFTGFTLFRPDYQTMTRLLFVDGQYLIEQHGAPNYLLQVYPPDISIAATETRRFRLLLLAFGSRLSGSLQTNALPPPFWPLHEETRDIRATVRPMNGWPWLPESAVYFNDGWPAPAPHELLSNPLLILPPGVSRVSAVPRGSAEKYQRPFDTGFSEVVYEVEARADVSGTLLPTRARLRVLTPYLNAEMRKTLEDRFRYTLEVEQIEFVPGTNSWLSRVPDGTPVGEHRTTQGRFYRDGYCYLLTNATLLPWEESERRRNRRPDKAQAELARAAEKAGTSSATPALLANSGLARVNTHESIRFTWPQGATGYSLYTTTDLTAPANWVQLTNGVALSNDQWIIDVPIAKTGARFFRLQSP